MSGILASSFRARLSRISRLPGVDPLRRKPKFRFNRKTGRFLFAYLLGYTDAGVKEGEKTPMMAIGQCAAS